MSPLFERHATVAPLENRKEMKANRCLIFSAGASIITNNCSWRRS